MPRSHVDGETQQPVVECTASAFVLVGVERCRKLRHVEPAALGRTQPGALASALYRGPVERGMEGHHWRRSCVCGEGSKRLARRCTGGLRLCAEPVNDDAVVGDGRWVADDDLEAVLDDQAPVVHRHGADGEERIDARVEARGLGIEDDATTQPRLLTAHPRRQAAATRACHG